MAYASASFLDGGLLHLKNNCDKLALVSSFTPGEAYATTVAAILAEVAMASGDFTISSSGSNRICTTATGKQDTAANATGGGASAVFVFLDTVNTEVLWETNETSAQTVTAGNPVNFPSLVYTSNQPT